MLIIVIEIVNFIPLFLKYLIKINTFNEALRYSVGLVPFISVKMTEI